jgi:GAF domain-containing protein
MALLQAVERLNAAATVSQVLEAIRSGARDLLRAQGAAISRLCAPVAGSGAPAARSHRSEATVTLEGWSLRLGRALWVENATAVDDLMLPPLEDGAPPGAAVAAPLFQGGQLLGVIALYYQTPRLFLTRDEQLLAGFLAQASAALQRAAGPVG